MTASTRVVARLAGAAALLPTARVAAQGTLRCTPGVVGPTDTLTLALSARHGAELSIETPAGEFFQLVAVDPDTSWGPMLMPALAFRLTRVVRLPVATSRARPFVRGRDRLERVFARPGRYRLRMADRLNTDDGTPTATCTVRVV